jgi:ABC-type uncharacterized transport system permease subunit
LSTPLNVASLILPLGYLLVAVGYCAIFFVSHAGAQKWAPRALRLFAFFHLLYLAGLTLEYGQFPAATVSQALSMIALAVAVVYIFVEARADESSTGFWLVLLVFVFQLLSSLLATPQPPARAIFHDPFFGVHVALALLGYAAFVVAAGYAFLYLQLYRDLKSGRFSTFFGKLPPLEALEKLMMGALVSGFVALTGASVVGAFWAQRLYPGAWLHDPKILSTFATWFLYALVLLFRRLRRWQGPQTAFASLAGLAAILFSLVAVNVFFTDFHGFL